MNTEAAIDRAVEAHRDRDTDRYTNGEYFPATNVPPPPQAEELSEALNTALDLLNFDGFVSVTYVDGNIDVQVSLDYFHATYTFSDTHVEEFPHLGCVRYSIKLQSGARIVAIQPREFAAVAV